MRIFAERVTYDGGSNADEVITDIAPENLCINEGFSPS